MLSNLAETLHSSAKSKNKQVAKIWGLWLKKQRFGATTICFPEGLEDTPWQRNINRSIFIHFLAVWILCLVFTVLMDKANTLTLSSDKITKNQKKRIWKPVVKIWQAQLYYDYFAIK